MQLAAVLKRKVVFEAMTRLLNATVRKIKPKKRQATLRSTFDAKTFEEALKVSCCAQSSSSGRTVNRRTAQLTRKLRLLRQAALEACSLRRCFPSRPLNSEHASSFRRKRRARRTNQRKTLARSQALSIISHNEAQLCLTGPAKAADPKKAEPAKPAENKDKVSADSAI